MSSLLGTLSVIISASTVGFAKAAKEIRTIDRAVQASTMGMAAGAGATGVAATKAGQASVAAAAAAASAAKQTNAALMSVGRTMTQFVTLPLGILAVVAVKTFSDFEYNLAKVVGLVGIAADKTAEWGEEILNISSGVGKGPKELSDALYFITSGGIRGAETMDVLRNSAKAATAGLGDTAKVADIVVSAMNAYGKENLSAAQATDILVMSVREGKAEADKLVTALGVVIPVAASMGVSFDQVGAAIAAMTRTGTKATTAGMQLRQILFALIKPAKQSKDAMTAMGTSHEELRKTIREKGLLTGLQQINTLTKKYGEEIMSRVFPNIRAFAGVIDILGENLQQNIIIEKNLANSTGALDAAFTAVSETYKFKMQSTFAEGSVMMAKFGEGIARVLIPILGSLQRIFKSVGDWFVGLSDSTQNLIVHISGFAVTVGPVLALVSAFRSLTGMGMGLKALAAAQMAQTGTTVVQTEAMLAKTAATEAAIRIDMAAVNAEMARVASLERAAAAQVQAAIATTAYAEAQTASTASTAFAARTQEFAARTQVTAAAAQQIAKEKLIALDVSLISAEEAVTRAYALSATASRNSVFANEALAFAKQQEVILDAELVAAEARVSKIMQSGTVYVLEQRAAMASLAVAQEASILSKQAVVKAEMDVAAAKVLETEATIALTYATNLATSAEAADVAAKEAQALAATSGTKAIYLQTRAQARQIGITRALTQAALAQAAAMKTASIATTTFTATTGVSNGILRGSHLLMAQNAQFATKALIAQNVAMINTTRTAGLMSKAFKAVGASMMAHPWMWAIAAGVAVYTLVKHLTKLTEVQKLQRKLTEDTADATATETSKLTSYLAIAQNEYTSRATRLEAIKKLNELSPAYLGNITEETVRTGQAKVAIDAYNKSLQERYRIQGAQESLIEWEKEYTKAVLDGSNKQISSWQKVGMAMKDTFFSLSISPVKDRGEEKSKFFSKIQEREKANAASAKKTYEDGKKYLIDELSNRKSITENIQTQYDYLLGKVDETITKEKEYQGILAKTGKEQTDAIAKVGQDYAERLLKGGKGNAAADLIKDLQDKNQEYLVSTVATLKNVLSDIQSEEKLLRDAADKYSLGAGTQGPLANKPAQSLGLAITSSSIIPNITQGVDAKKLAEMRTQLNKVIDEFEGKIIPIKVDTSEASFELLKFTQELQSAFETQKRESELFSGSGFDIVAEKLKVYEKALKDVAAAKSDEVNINSKWVQQLKLNYDTTKLAVDAMKKMSDEQDRSVAQFEAQMEAEFQAQQKADDLASSLLHAETVLSVWDLAMQGMTNSTYDAVVEFEELQKIIKELEKNKGFLSTIPDKFEGFVSSGAPLTPPAPLMSSPASRFEKVKAGSFDMDIENTLQEMNTQFDTASRKAEELNGVWNGLNAQMDILENSLRKALNIDLVNATDEQFKQWAKTVSGITIELEKLKTIEFGNNLESIVMQGRLAGGTFDLLGATLSETRTRFQELWDRGIRPGNAEMDKLMSSISDMQGVLNAGEAFSALGSGLNEVNSALGGASDGWVAWVAQVLNDIPKIISMFTSLVAMKQIDILTTQGQNTVSQQSILVKQQEQIEIAKLLGTKIAETVVTATDTGATTANTAATMINTGASIANAAASTTQTVADSGAAIAGATKAGAKLPFPANIVAIVAGVVAVVSAIAMVPKVKASAKMKTGGVIPQGYPNDSFPALLSSGEMVVPENKTKEFLSVINKNKFNAEETTNNSKEIINKTLSSTKVQSYEDIMSIPTTINKTINSNTIANTSVVEDIPKMKTGGTIPSGFPNDTFPALLTSGEMVVPVDKVRTFEQIMKSQESTSNVLKLKGGGIVSNGGGVVQVNYEDVLKAQVSLINMLKDYTQTNAVQAISGSSTEYGTSDYKWHPIDQAVLNTDTYKKYVDTIKQFQEYENTLEDKTRFFNSTDFRKGNIKINDTRNVPDTKKMSHVVNEQTVRDITSGSLQRQLDPSTVLAMALQETGIKNFNPLHNNDLEESTVLTQDSLGIQGSLDFLVKKFNYAEKLGKTKEEDVIQSWNGYGKIKALGNEGGLYGTKEAMDMNKNPVYGQRVTALRDSAISVTPEIVKIIEEELRKYNIGVTPQLLPKSIEQKQYAEGLGSSLTGVTAPSDMKFKEPLYDLSKFGIGTSLTAIENNTKPILDGELANNISSGVGEIGIISSVIGLVGIIGKLFKGKSKKMATGGLVPQGYPNDTFSAMLSSGELVVPEKRAQEVLNVLNNINKAKKGQENILTSSIQTRNNTAIPKMATGGVVPQGYSNDTYPAMLTSGEMIVPPMKLPDFKRKNEKVRVVVEGQIKGTDIYYVMKEVGRKYQNSY